MRLTAVVAKCLSIVLCFGLVFFSFRFCRVTNTQSSLCRLSPSVGDEVYGRDICNLAKLGRLGFVGLLRAVRWVRLVNDTKGAPLDRDSLCDPLPQSPNFLWAFISALSG